MKRVFLLSILALSAGLKAMAGTLSGTVYYQAAPSPADVWVPVTISDTLGTWSTVVYTDYDGHYTVTIPASVSTTAPGNQINVSINHCGAWQRQVVINSGSPVANFNICAGQPPISGVQGTVTLSGGSVANTGQAKIYLIRKSYDAFVGDTVLTAIDSFLTAASGGSFSKTYAAKPTGYLTMKAMLLPGHPNYSNYLPTYANNSWPLTSTGAQALSASVFTGGATLIDMVAGLNPGGPGFIGGRVSLGANKTAGVGDPLPGRALMLIDKSTRKAVAWTQSDAAGQFKFPSVPYGTYEIFGDQFGKSNPKLTLTVSAASPRVANILFEENDKKFAGKFEYVGVEPRRPLSTLALSPNPASDRVKVSGLAAIMGAKTIIVQSITGAEISRQTVLNGDAWIPTSMLPAGLYNVLVQTEQGSTSLKLTK